MTEKLLLSPEDSAQTLGIGRSKIYQLIESKELDSVKIGRSRRISVKALEAYIDRLAEVSKAS